MRRKRRSKYTWFPVLAQGDEAGQGISGADFGINLNTNGQAVTGVFAVTFDAPKEPGEADLATSGELAGMVGQEYFIRRIVGKCFIAHTSRPVTNDEILETGPNAVLVAAGFFVARADEDPNDTIPIGSATAATLFSKYSPLSGDAIREPWLWRRTWILGNQGNVDIRNNQLIGDMSFTGNTIGTLSTAEMTAYWPTTNAGYGSIQDGPHIDAKTARRVGQDDRLWFAVAATSWPLAAASTRVGRIDGHLDMRLLGQLRKARSRGSF